MSRNLHLTSKGGGSVGLYQTPTRITNEAMKLYDAGSTGEGAAALAVTVYERYLREEMQLSAEEVKEAIDRINAFIAFTPGARFEGY